MALTVWETNQKPFWLAIFSKRAASMCWIAPTWKRSKLKRVSKGQQQKLKGASYVITGDVTEFGRKEVGDHQLWGILGRGKTQVAYAKTTLNVVNVQTSEVVYSVQGAGEYTFSNREIIGFGGTASYAEWKSSGSCHS